MFKKNLKKRVTLGIIILAAALAFGGCSRKSARGLESNNVSYKTQIAAGAVGDSYDYEYDYNTAEYAEAPAAEENYVTGDVNGIVDTGSGTIVDPGAAQKRKLIRTVDLEVETKEYDKVITDVEAKIAELGGYIEQQYSYNGKSYSTQGSQVRTATMTVRIPDDKLDEFVTTMSGISNVISKRTTAQDVTLQYTDIESKRDMYRAEQESLLQLLERAQTVEDITYLTQCLTEVRYNIESMERQLRVYDNQVDYATINLNINEVEVLTPQVVEKKSDKDEVKDGFRASWANIGNAFKNFGMNFVINLPYLILAAAVLAIQGIVALIVVAAIKRKVRKNRAAKKAVETRNSEEAKPAEKAESTESEAAEEAESAESETAEEGAKENAAEE